MDLNAIAQPELDQVARIGNADIAIGILDLDHDQDGSSAISITREALAEISKPLRAVVICNNGTHGSVAACEAADDRSSQVFTCSFSPRRPAETLQQSISNAYRDVFTVGVKLGVRACGMVVYRPQTETSLWISRLVQPVVNLGFDLVAPSYTRQKFEGLLNKCILSPLHRALYGEQLQNPMGPEFGLSGKLLKQILALDSAPRAEHHCVATIAPAAASGGFAICESYLGVRAQHPTDWTNLSSLLADILGITFVEMEGRAGHWQSIRGSRGVPRFGVQDATPADTGSIDVHAMVESFQLGAQNLQDVWGLILPPTTLLELRRLSRLAPDQFRMQDQLWVRIVYDFALGHRLRTISRDHLLRSMTPLYLGWIASYSLEMQSAGASEVDSRLDRLAKAYEDNKSYLVSRWRWPDRFNP